MELKEVERCCCVVRLSDALSTKARVSCSGVVVHPRTGTVICTGVPFSRFFADAEPLSADRRFLSPRSFGEKLRISVTFPPPRESSSIQSSEGETCDSDVPAELLLMVNCLEFGQALRTVFLDADQWRFHGDEDGEALPRDAQFLSWFALLKTDVVTGRSPDRRTTPWHSSAHLQKGHPVVACGSPFGSLCPDLFISTLSGGIVSNLTGRGNAVILTDARCLPGTEGGGLFVAVRGTDKARLVGLIVSPFGWKAHEWIGLTLVCSIHAIFGNIARCAGGDDPLRDVWLDGAQHPGGGAIHPGGGAIHPGGGAIHPGDGAIHPGGGAIHPGGGAIHPGGGAKHPGDRSWLHTSAAAHGSEALGSEALGSEALGSEALGSEALGSEALGSEALGYPTVCLVDSVHFWGSGVLVTSRMVVTCRHVVNGKPTVTLKLHLSDRVHDFVGDVLFSTKPSSPYDLALVQLRGSVSEAAAPRMAQSFDPGDSVVVVGYGGLGRGSGPSFTCGVLSKAIRLDDRPVMLQTTCAVHAGSSGGAVVRRRSGELLGIVSSNTRDFAAKVTYPHLNFCIPVTVFQGLLQHFQQTKDINVFRLLDTTEEEVRRVWRLQGVRSKM